MQLRVEPSIALQVDRPEAEPYPEAETVLDKAPPQSTARPPTDDEADSGAALAADRAENVPAPRPDRHTRRDRSGRRSGDAPPTDASGEPSPTEPAPVALFVTHGMGQQVPFATLDMVATGLERALKRRQDPRMRGISVAARTVQLGDLRVERVEMGIGPKDATTPTARVHIYEGYWAPLTEGKVTLRDVMAFLYRGAWNGLKKGIGQPMARYMFGSQALHSVPWLAFLGLLVTTLVLGALVLLNTVIAGVVLDAGYAVLSDRGTSATGTVGAEVGSALTGIVFWYLVATLLFGAMLGVLLPLAARNRERTPHPLWRLATGVAWWLGFWPWILATLAAGVLMLAVLLQTILPAGLEPGPWLYVPRDVAARLVLAALGAALYSIWDGRRVRRRYEEEVEAQPGAGQDVKLLSGSTTTLIAVLLLGAALAAFGLLILELALRGTTGALADSTAPWMNTGWFRTAVWTGLFGVSALIRNVIVQYFGDVAAYVSSHALDRFADLRKAIKDVVRQVLNGLYHHVEHGRYVYEDIAVVGHSLGSVVAYDALNGALNEDERTGGRIGVRTRTKLLLTFGSPLDKTAYIFRGQNQSLSLVREALANAVQPMVQHYKIRAFPWINVHARRDVIGSPLDLYDRPAWKTDQRKAVAAAKKARAKKSNASSLKAMLDDLEAKAREAKEQVREVERWAHPDADFSDDTAPCLYCVHDIEDEHALIPLVAHNEHWQTAVVFDVLVEQMVVPALERAAVHKAARRDRPPS